MKSVAIEGVILAAAVAPMFCRGETPATQPTIVPTTTPATGPSTAPAVLPLTPAAAAYSTTQPYEDPEAYLDRLLRAKPGMARPLQPVPPEEATAEPIKKKKELPKDPSRPLKRDGDVARDRIGYLERTPDDAVWQYVFESNAQGMVDPPMIVVPNRRLAAMEAAQEKAAAPIRFRVTGMITRFENQNYLIIERAREWPTTQPTTEATTQPGDDESVPTTAPAKLPVSAAPGTQPATSPATEPTTLPASQPATQPFDAEQMLQQMLRARPRMAPPLQTPKSEAVTTTRAVGVAPAEPAVAVRPDGDMIIQRMGRLIPGKDGAWSVFVFESDEKGMADPPMQVIPNQRLTQMLAALERAGVDLRFSVTGSVTAYHGRNYLLIEKAELVTEHEGL